MTQLTDGFKQEAQRLFDDEIKQRWELSDNVWRNGWAMDTLLDYFAVCDIDGSPYGQTALDVLNPTKKGNWWDDFGWIGIASLRAAEQKTFGNHRDELLKIAINSWAYMYGPGWSATNRAIYPFTDVPGWEEFESQHTRNVGAPNVWTHIEETWETPPITQDEMMQRKPRYSPGGAWNSTITDAQNPSLVPSYTGKEVGGDLAPIQNTVTNGLYAILTLRIYQASQNAEFSSVFTESKLDADACLQAWKDQIQWFNQWMVNTSDSEQSLLLKLATGSSLVRERASTFGEWKNKMHWDASYRKNLAWTGDQGLLLGALREGQAAGYVNSEVLSLYPDIVEGVFANGYWARTYSSSVAGSFLLPWLVIGSSDPYTATSPGSDDPDYHTGNAVFMRYLLQAYHDDPDLVNKYKDKILNSANNIIKAGFGTQPAPAGSCEAFAPSGNAVDQMTAYVNRLSVLLLAIVISE